MLDEHDRDPLRDERAHELPQAPRLARVHPRRGLVEDQHARLGSERPRDLEPPLVPVGELAGERAGATAQADALQQTHGALAIRIGARTSRHQTTNDVRTHARVAADEHVVEHGEPLEEPHALERPRDPPRRELVRCEARHRRAVQEDAPAVGAQVPRDEIDERRLAGAVRADEPEGLPRRDREVDPVHGVDAAEGPAELPRLKQHPRLRSRRGGASCEARRASRSRAGDR